MAVVAVLIFGLVLLRVVGAEKPTDEEQIHMLLERGRTSIERKDLRGVLSCISSDYSDSAGQSFDVLRLHAINAFRMSGSYRVTLQNTVIRVTGDAATAETRVSVALSQPGSRTHSAFDGTVRMRLRRENGRSWLVIPTRVWKVVELEGLPDEFDSYE